jgi:DNA topoisomerase-3
VPTQLGLSIYESYKSVNKEALMFDPEMRSRMEKDLKNICEGSKLPETVLRETLSEMTEVYNSTLKCK